MAQTEVHVAHCVTQLYPQSQLELLPQREAYVVHVFVLFARPASLLPEAGVKMQPCACRHCAFVAPEHVPMGVPVQFGDQKQPGTFRQR